LPQTDRPAQCRDEPSLTLRLKTFERLNSSHHAIWNLI
jgi:hypothetical protein